MNAIDLVHACVLESGRRWGEVAVAQQRRDAEAFFDPAGPRWHFITRPRGGSKTVDLALFSLAWLVCEAPAGATADVVANSQDQAALLVEAIASVVHATPELRSAVAVQAYRVSGRNGASIEVLAADSGSAWGRRPSLLIIDEYAQAAVTRKSRQLWLAMLTSVQKIPGSRLAILTSAGEPGHPSYRVLQEALRSDLWRVSEMPGPVPWQSPADLEAIRAQLRPDEYDRLILNRWTDTPDVLVSAEDLDAACVLPSELPPVPGVRYVVTLDYGPKRDRTAVAVCHAERLGDAPGASQRVVCDAMRVWQGSRLRSVPLSEVEEFMVEVSRRFNRAVAHCDPYQSIGLIQRLNARGVRALEFPFTSQSVNRVASALVVAFQNRLVLLPDDRELRDELSRVRLKSAGPGSVKLDNPAGTHDDRATVLGMACAILQGSSAGQGAVYLEYLRQQVAAQAAAAPVVPRPLRGLPRFEDMAAVEVCRCRPGVRRFYLGRCTVCQGVRGAGS